MPKLNSGNINSYLNNHAIQSFLIKNLNILSGNVLDIGCGKMIYKDVILSGKNTVSYIGLDLKQDMFSYSVKADIYWDGTKIPLVDNSIDSAILFEVIEHCPDPHIVLSETLRVLRPGGTLLFSIPFLYQLHGVPFDFQRLTPFGAENLLKSSGFLDIKIAASGSFDASLGQMIAIWITHRPMSKILRKILGKIFVPLFKVLLKIDGDKDTLSENTMITGILGSASKP